jgi:hypothetical protein
MDVACAAVLGALTLSLPLPAFAQNIDNSAFLTAPVARVGAAGAPVIDADLSDAAWQSAPVIDDLRQVTPNAGEPATERTEIRVLFDENNIYFGIHAYDSEPDQVIVRTLARDGELGTGDFIRIYLDPAMTRRNAYVFDIGPEGARTEGLLENNADILFEWDTIWEARATRTADGWVAEVAIPFRSISYDAASSDWGFDFHRVIRRKTERVRWTSFTETIAPNDVSQSGTLQGIEAAGQGLGLDVQVYGRATYKQNWQDSNDSALSGALGGNVYYRITPALTGTLTFNPDFSDSPLDERQVNTSRFSLFTPETRDFFLQDAATFEFGGRNFVDAENARPFFSRNIGLIEGVPVSIVAGGKLSGEIAGFGIGALTAVTNETSTTPSQVLTVARVTRPILGESKIGAIFTNGDPTGDTNNTVAGADFQYRNSNLWGDNLFTADVFYERSFSDDLGDDDSFGLAVNFPNEPWRGNFSYKQVGENFDPALGFANRRGIRLYDTFGGYRLRFRDTYLRTIDFNAKDVIVTDLNNHVQSRESRLWLMLNNRFADQLTLNVYRYYEDVPDPFDLPRDVIVPVGEYDWVNFNGYLDTTMGRSVVVTTEIECCSFYNGSYFKTDFQVAFRPNEIFEIVPRYVGEFIDLPTGYVEIHIFSLETAANFTADMQLALQAQFDTISRNFGLSARYRWEYSPGNEVFVGFGQTALIPGTHFSGQTITLSVRLGRTFRF